MPGGPGFCIDLSDDDGAHRRDATTASAASASATSIWSSSTKRTGRFTKSTARSSSISIPCWLGSPRRRRTKSIATLTDCLTLKTACRPTTTRSTKRSETASSCRRKLFPCLYDSSAKGFHTTNCPKRKKKSGMRLEWSDDGTIPNRRGSRGGQPRGCSTKIPWTRCWSI